jgi:hypothetical protein
MTRRSTDARRTDSAPYSMINTWLALVVHADGTMRRFALLRTPGAVKERAEADRVLSRSSPRDICPATF